MLTRTIQSTIADVDQSIQIGREQGFRLGVGNLVGTNQIAQFAVGNDFNGQEVDVNTLSEGILRLSGTAGTGAGVGRIFSPRVTGLVNNPIPTTFARVVPGNVKLRGLGLTNDVFVTDAASLRGLNAKQIANKLGILERSSFNVIEFPSSNIPGIASPVGRSNLGFVGRGLTSGKAPEFVIPNAPIPAGAIIRRVR